MTSPGRTVTAAERHLARDAIVRNLPRAAGVSVLTLSAVVLLGWALDVRAMQSLYPGFVTMKANTAAGLGVAAIALLVLNREDAVAVRDQWIARVLCALVVLIGVLTLTEYAFGVDLGIDQLLFRATTDAALTRTPGRMAVVTALALVLLGLALAPVRRTARWSEYVQRSGAIAVAALGLTSLLGYVYGAIPTTGLGQGMQIAPHTAFAFVVLSAGCLTSSAQADWMATVLSDRAGGVLARRLLPVAFLVPLVLGALRQIGARFGNVNIADGSASLAVTMMIAFDVLIWRAAVALNHADDASRAADQARFALSLQEAAARERLEREQQRRKMAEAARSTAELAVREKDIAYSIIDQALSAAEEQRETAERAVQSREETLVVLDRVMESTPIGIAVVDLDLRFVHINSALAAVDGRLPAAHLGRAVRDMLPAFGAGMETSLRRVLDAGAPIQDCEWTTETAGNPTRRRSWLLSFYPLRSSDGVLTGAGVTAVDTTEQQHLAMQLRQSQKMEAVGQLAGGVAHDFNNILTIITSYTGLLLQDLPPGAAMRDDIQQISDAAERASGLTRQMLAFSRQQVLEPRVVDLNALTKEMEKMLRRLLPASIRLETRLQPVLGLVVADPGQLEQVLMNLVVNARDAMRDGGRLIVETALVTLGEASDERPAGVQVGEYVTLSVRDTGCGMDDEVRARVFDPFFTTKEKGHGTGLGLSTAYGIVQQSGGFISVDSEPGEGSVFTVYLARSDLAPTPQVPAYAHPPLARSAERILLAEDEPAVRAVATTILGRAGYVVLAAANGEEALEIAGDPAAHIDLLLTDLVMPKLNGRDLAERFRTLHPTAAIAYTSGYTEEASQRRNVFEAGAVFIQKPFTPARLLEKVREALDASEDLIAAKRG